MICLPRLGGMPMAPLLGGDPTCPVKIFQKNIAEIVFIRLCVKLSLACGFHLFKIFCCLQKILNKIVIPARTPPTVGGGHYSLNFSVKKD